jgi:hypothetical protein
MQPTYTDCLMIVILAENVRILARGLAGKIGVWGATEQKTGLRNDRYSSSGASGLRRGRN